MFSCILLLPVQQKCWAVFFAVLFWRGSFLAQNDFEVYNFQFFDWAEIRDFGTDKHAGTPFLSVFQRGNAKKINHEKTREIWRKSAREIKRGVELFNDWQRGANFGQILKNLETQNPRERQRERQTRQERRKTTARNTGKTDKNAPERQSERERRKIKKRAKKRAYRLG